METPAYDLIVIGAGPAGLTAATEVARAGLRALCLDKLAPGGMLINLGELHDFEESFNGTQMAAQLTDEAAVAGVEIGFAEVSSISNNGLWTVETADGERHTARALVIATGMNKGKLGVSNEEEFEGRGLSHCAICDGPLYAGQPVIVAGATGWAPHEAAALVGIAGKITMLGRPTVDPPPGIEVADGCVVGLEGDDGLQKVVIECDGTRKAVSANAVFVYVGQSPAAEFLRDSLARDASGHIVIDEEGRTSAPLVFAAGDVRAGGRQYLADVIADGQRVAKSVVAALGQQN